MEEIQKSWKEHWYEVIFEADTPAGKAFDVVLLVMIAMSVVTVMLESVPEYRETHGVQLQRAEWFFTIAFTLEYIARIACAPRRGAYVRSFFGMVDLLAILPTYFMVLYPGAQSLAVLRALRLLRVFRVLKLAHMLREASALRRALWQSRSKIAVFLSFVVIVSAIIGSSMYVIEGEEAGFTSIPQGMYWAIVTMTTVGYGDIAPLTPLGKLLAAIVMILGYSIIVVPTGIVSAEIASIKPVSTQVCPSCMAEGHDTDATHCKFCGGKL